MKYALILPGQDAVLQISDHKFEVAPPLRWESCPDECTTDWKFNPSGSFAAPEPPTQLAQEDKEYLIKLERNKRLQASDWTQAADIISLKSPEWVAAWAAYRQALRDMFNEPVDLDSPVFPEVPRV